MDACTLLELDKLLDVWVARERWRSGNSGGLGGAERYLTTRTSSSKRPRKGLLTYTPAAAYATMAGFQILPMMPTIR